MSPAAPLSLNWHPRKIGRCDLCGEDSGPLFDVPDNVWLYYVGEQQRHQLVCIGCWDTLVQQIDGGAFQIRHGSPLPLWCDAWRARKKAPPDTPIPGTWLLAQAAEFLHLHPIEPPPLFGGVSLYEAAEIVAEQERLRQIELDEQWERERPWCRWRFNGSEYRSLQRRMRQRPLCIDLFICSDAQALLEIPADLARLFGSMGEPPSVFAQRDEAILRRIVAGQPVNVAAAERSM
jgi:hypothetical protein